MSTHCKPGKHFWGSHGWVIHCQRCGLLWSARSIRAEYLGHVPFGTDKHPLTEEQIEMVKPITEEKVKLLRKP